MTQAVGGTAAASIFSILRNSPGAVVRYTLDRTPVTATSKIDAGIPIPLASGATVHAALFVTGKAQHVLTTSATAEPAAAQ